MSISQRFVRELNVSSCSTPFRGRSHHAVPCEVHAKEDAELKERRFQEPKGKRCESNDVNNLM